MRRLMEEQLHAVCRGRELRQLTEEADGCYDDEGMHAQGYSPSRHQLARPLGWHHEDEALMEV